MKITVKRVTVVSMIVLAAAAPLAFSGGKQEAGAAAPSTEAAAPTTINFFHMTWVPEMIELMDLAVETFMEGNPNIQIEQTRVSWTDAPAQLLTSIMGGASPDISEANPTMVAQFRAMGAYSDVTDVLLPKVKNNLLPGALNIIQTPEGRIDGFPTEGCTWTYFFRDDLFGAAGVAAHPKTWDELLASAKKLTRDKDGDGVTDQWGYGHPVQAENAVQFWQTWMWQAGSPVVKYQEGQWYSDLNSPAALKGTRFMVDLVQKHRVMPATIVDMDWEAVTNGFAFGDFAIMYNGAWVVGAVKAKAPELDGKWSTGLTPSVAPGKETATMGHPNTFNILKASRNKKAAVEFLNWMYVTEYKDGKTYADEYAYRAGALNFTKDYLAWAKRNYEPLLQPFLDAVAYSKPLAMDPKWQQFAELYGRAAVQDMLQGKLEVEQTMKFLHEQLTKLQGH
jgi:multiple sugar transport system substrate-binding protein